MGETLRVVLIGEINPLSAEPRYALYPFPAGCSGHRLAVMMGYVSRTELVAYCGTFHRMNFWPSEGVRKCVKPAAQARMLVSYLEGRRVVVVGYRVAGWFGMKFDYCTWVEHRGATMAYIPHPSGRNRLWNYPAVVFRVDAFLAEVRWKAEAEYG